MKCSGIPVDGDAHVVLRPPANVKDALVVTGQIATPAELRPMTDGAYLSALQHRLQREREFVTQRIITTKQNKTKRNVSKRQKHKTSTSRWRGWSGRSGATDSTVASPDSTPPHTNFDRSFSDCNPRVGAVRTDSACSCVARGSTSLV